MACLRRGGRRCSQTWAAVGACRASAVCVECVQPGGRPFHRVPVGGFRPPGLRCAVVRTGHGARVMVSTHRRRRRGHRQWCRRRWWRRRVGGGSARCSLRREGSQRDEGGGRNGAGNKRCTRASGERETVTASSSRRASLHGDCPTATRIGAGGGGGVPKRGAAKGAGKVNSHWRWINWA